MDALTGITQPRARFDADGYIVETQYSYGGFSAFDVIAGGGYYTFDFRTTEGESSEFQSTRHGNAYVYTHLHYPQSLTWNFGLSADWFDDSDPGTLSSVNPKFGILWNVTPRTLLRAAVVKVRKRTRLANQTLEATQVAGFNQFFDDFNGTESVRYGGGIDQRFTASLAGGFEISKRDLDVRILGDEEAPTRTDQWEESLYRSYLHWTPHPHWAVSVDYVNEDFTNRGESGPRDTETQVVSAGISYFSPSGFFAKFNTSHLDQEVVIGQSAVSDSDSTVFLDLSSGYRLPKRRGIFEITLQNLLDQNYQFEGDQGRRAMQNDSFPSFLPFPPEITISARLTLAF